MEAIYLDCGARRPQLKRNPLGGRTARHRATRSHCRAALAAAARLAVHAARCALPICLDSDGRALQPDRDSDAQVTLRADDLLQCPSSAGSGSHARVSSVAISRTFRTLSATSRLVSTSISLSSHQSRRSAAHDALRRDRTAGRSVRTPGRSICGLGHRSWCAAVGNAVLDSLELVRRPPNQRLKLSGCGGRLKGNGSLLIAAAAPRSLSAIR